MAVYQRKCRKNECLHKRRRCRHKVFVYDFRIRRERYRGSLPEARTIEQARKAESRIRDLVWERKFGGILASPLFAEFVRDHYLPWAKAHKRSWHSDEWRCEVLIKHFGSKPLDEIDAEMIERFKTIRCDSITQYGRRRSKTSVNRELEVLSKVFTLANRLDKAAHNPCRKVERFTLQNSRPRYFTHDEEARLIDACTGTLAHLRPYVIVGIGTGLRPPSEIFGLKKSKVDFERNLLTAGTKTNEERSIPMSAAVRACLLELHRKNPDNEHFFDGRGGAQMKVVKNGFRKALKNAKIEAASSYVMRHTFATRLGEAGYNAYEIMALMGHTDIKTSARYVHPTDERTRAAVESVSRYRVQSPHLFPANGGNEKKLVVVNG